MSQERRVAVITGATGVLGNVLAQDLAARNMRLALISREGSKLTTLAKSLPVNERDMLTCEVDLADANAVRDTAAAVVEKFGRVDVLLHLVGGWTGGKTLVETPASDLEDMLSQHVWTSFHVTKAFLPYLVENGWGRVIMITSPFAARPAARGGAYAIAKAGQDALMFSLAQELRGTGVTANLLQVKTIDVKRDKVANPSSENTSWTTPEELSSAVMHLLSNEAASVNGARIPMFGGRD